MLLTHIEDMLKAWIVLDNNTFVCNIAICVIDDLCVGRFFRKSNLQAYVVFATHYLALASLAALYPAVEKLQFLL